MQRYEENEKYYKNGAVITNDTGNVVDEITFKSLIKKETSTFIHKSFSNIIVLVGAGASVLCNSGNIDEAGTLCILVGAFPVPGATNPELLPIVIAIACSSINS